MPNMKCSKVFDENHLHDHVYRKYHKNTTGKAPSLPAPSSLAPKLSFHGSPRLQPLTLPSKHLQHTLLKNPAVIQSQTNPNLKLTLTLIPKRHLVGPQLPRPIAISLFSLLFNSYHAPKATTTSYLTPHTSRLSFTMGDYKPLSEHSYRHSAKAGGAQLTREERFWRSFKPLSARDPAADESLQKLKRVQALFADADDAELLSKAAKLPSNAYQLSAAVHSVHICAAAPFDFCVTAGTRLHIYDGRTAQLKKTISRFKGTAYSGELRAEGSLVVAGCDNGHISVFNAQRGALMRVFKGHRKAVQVTRWARDKASVFSCSDDKTLRHWDLATEKLRFEVQAHGDYIRAGALAQGAHGFVTGGYDRMVKVWDARSPRAAVLSVEHGAPVEAVVALQGGSLVCSAAGKEVKIWDVLGGGRLAHSFSHHGKAIMDISIDGTGTRLLSCGLDQHVKVVDLKTFACVAQIKEKAGIMAARANSDNSKIVAGLVTGEVVVRQRKKSASKKDAKATEALSKPPRAGSFRYFMRGSSVGPQAGDVMVKRNKKRKLQAYDRHLRKFNYKQALDAALQTRQPYTVATLLDELRQRSGLGR